jgi:ribulose kinase
MEVPELADTTCLGAALLGAMAGGVFADLDEARSALRLPMRVVEPMPECDDTHLERRQATYAAAYAAMRPLHARLLDG